MRKKISFYILLLSSFSIVSLGQPAWLGWLGYLASFGGYALFWRAMVEIERLKGRFLLASLWFTLVQAVALSWMCSLKYPTQSNNVYIYILYLVLVIGLGGQFGLLSLFVGRNLKGWSVLPISAFWILMEYLRLCILCGFTWNPVGLALATNHFSLQMAAIVGIYGLSFWVIMVNLLGYRAIISPSIKLFCIWLVLGSFPYLFGIWHQKFQEARFEARQDLKVILVQTALFPEQKDPYLVSSKSFISPYKQWERILGFLKKEGKSKVDLIVLPETALPFQAYFTFYDYGVMKKIWEEKFGELALTSLPPLQTPLADKDRVSNAYISQAIANFFNAQVIIGLLDRAGRDNYNSAFCFYPHEHIVEKYDKQILVPVGEYFPFSWVKFIAAPFGISDTFAFGKNVKIFPSTVPLAVSICYEETFGHLIRKSKKKGAKLLVNISNDSWFPFSRLARQHFELGRIRSVENGVPLIRATTTGITGGVDCFGRIVKILSSKEQPPDKIAKALYLSLPTYNYSTLYTFWGDSFILIGSLAIIAVYLLWYKRLF